MRSTTQTQSAGRTGSYPAGVLPPDKKFRECLCRALPCPALSFIESLEVSISDPTIRQSSYLAITTTACRHGHNHQSHMASSVHASCSCRHSSGVVFSQGVFMTCIWFYLFAGSQEFGMCGITHSLTYGNVIGIPERQRRWVRDSSISPRSPSAVL